MVGTQRATVQRSVLRVPATLVAAVALLAAACSGSAPATSAPATSAPATSAPATSAPATAAPATSPSGSTASELLPQAIRDAGVIRMATGTTYRPYAYLEGDKWIGHDVDLMNAMAADLGVKVELANVQWASLIPGVQSGRYDVLMDGMGDNAVREEVIDFVNYFRVHEALVVPKGNPKGITATNYCGFTFAENVGSLEIGYIEELGKKCVEEGKPPTVLLAQKTTPEGFVAIEAGRADAMMTPSAPAVAAANLNPDKWEAMTDVFEGFSFSNGLLLGIGTQKGATDLQNALVWALDRQIQSGFYAENMKKYGMPENGAIEKATVNAGPASMTGG